MSLAYLIRALILTSSSHAELTIIFPVVCMAESNAPFIVRQNVNFEELITKLTLDFFKKILYFMKDIHMCQYCD